MSRKLTHYKLHLPWANWSGKLFTRWISAGPLKTKSFHDANFVYDKNIYWMKPSLMDSPHKGPSVWFNVKCHLSRKEIPIVNMKLSCLSNRICHSGNTTSLYWNHWKQRIIMMPTLSSLVAPHVVMMNRMLLWWTTVPPATTKLLP